MVLLASHNFVPVLRRSSTVRVPPEAWQCDALDEEDWRLLRVPPRVPDNRARSHPVVHIGPPIEARMSVLHCGYGRLHKLCRRRQVLPKPQKKTRKRRARRKRLRRHRR
ncbi:ORF050L [giant sea perch iridovirus - K1]|uniref:ORF050L n=1 Tax=Giant seaperch iridovirus TaxID=176655 RepID=A0A140GBF0_GSIV|nr:ORF050L [giant sea perch iridovirus - K1]